MRIIDRVTGMPKIEGEQMNGNKLAMALVGILAGALMGCVGWMAKPTDGLGRREWDQYVLKRDAEQSAFKESLSEIKTDVRLIRADVSTLMRTGAD